ncbi:MAG: sulfhydrogenase subunit delta [Candidatus Thiodiazotropha endolucinida]|nr:sulfhydrogenase subunit delta [Candidatus Thiodiazotropha taylori]MCW4315815.1 sulfhydrogenase subunit delta [Candidatus Thiodiazotropha taylori]
MATDKPKLAVHKFSSCDGCQLALLNLGEPLLALPGLVDIVHFAEAGPNSPDQAVDISLVEGSVSTPEDIQRIQQVRQNSKLLVSIGACATSGGLQALGNFANRHEWMASVYSDPEKIEVLNSSDPISKHVKVDLQIQGCPVNSTQVIGALRDLLSGVAPRPEVHSVCMECKRKGLICTMVTQGEPCMGPVTLAGCSALCPAAGRGCYGCYGPAEQLNDRSISDRFEQLGLDAQAVLRRFRFIANSAAGFKAASEGLRGDTDG